MLTAPLVPLHLDRLRHLCLDLPALQRADHRMIERLGPDGSIYDALDGLTRRRFDHLEVLLWAALLHEDPELTEGAVARMVHLGNLGRVVQALQRCVTEQFAETTPEEANGHPLVPDASTGSSSGAMDALSLALPTPTFAA